MKRTAQQAQDAKPRRRTPERTEQAEIVKLLRMLGASVYVLGTTRRKGDHPGTMQTPGIPDLWVVFPSTRQGLEWTALWIEVKAEKGRLSRAQQRFQNECFWSSTTHLVGGLDVVVAWCQKHGWLKQ
jgi:hypothetical protein